MRISSLLSLVGVLSAGSAAAVINNEVLHQSDADAAVGVAVDANVEPAIEIQSAALTATQVMFQVGEAGFVTLDTAGQVLTVVTVTLDTGWDLVSTQAHGATRVDLLMQHGDDSLRFTGELVGDGVVGTIDPDPEGIEGAADANGLDASGGANTNTSSSTSGGIGGSGGGDEDADGTDDGVDDGIDTDDGCPSDADVSVCVDVEAGADLNDD